jgi:hypothetical protein
MTRTLITILSVSLPLIVLTGCLASPKQTPPKGTPPVTQQESEKQKALARRSLAPFTILEGTPYKLGAVVESEGKDRGFLSGSSSSYKGDSYGYSKQFNYIFLNTQTKESVKLLPKSDLLFTRLEKIGKKNEKGESMLFGMRRLNRVKKIQKIDLKRRSLLQLLVVRTIPS